MRVNIVLILGLFISDPLCIDQRRFLRHLALPVLVVLPKIIQTDAAERIISAAERQIDLYYCHHKQYERQQTLLTQQFLKFDFHPLFSFYRASQGSPHIPHVPRDDISLPQQARKRQRAPYRRVHTAERRIRAA